MHTYLSVLVELGGTKVDERGNEVVRLTVDVVCLGLFEKISRVDNALLILLTHGRSLC